MSNLPEPPPSKHCGHRKTTARHEWVCVAKPGHQPGAHVYVRPGREP